MSIKEAIEQCDNAIKYSGSSETANLARDIKAELLESEPERDHKEYIDNTITTRTIPIQIDENLSLPPIHVFKKDDGYVLEWIFESTRIGISIDKDGNKGWWVVSDQITASGEL